ncbi:hypothetical protein [Polaromonas sp.]|uniref:hypothetical protein n=1 Tax=Polaromonas sp. TaxID=1869339 RepID=UPI001DFC880C|nr:hypothetical protein [Polaromonas sp.]MBT9474268.1 hypothetical protein [Polaromonas sp.]
MSAGAGLAWPGLHIPIVRAELMPRCFMPCKGMSMDCMAQVHVACAMVPFQDSDAQGLLTKLEQLLAAVPVRSKRAVFKLGESPKAAWPPEPANSAF